jgi:hypothetical protein
MALTDAKIRAAKQDKNPYKLQTAAMRNAITPETDI